MPSFFLAITWMGDHLVATNDLVGIAVHDAFCLLIDASFPCYNTVQRAEMLTDNESFFYGGHGAFLFCFLGGEKVY